MAFLLFLLISLSLKEKTTLQQWRGIISCICGLQVIFNIMTITTEFSYVNTSCTQ